MNHVRNFARKSLRRRNFSLQSQSQSLCKLSQQSNRPCYGIAFDIDGVILLGSSPIGGSPGALRRLYDDSGALKIPFLFLSNGGGQPEFKRASELSNLVGVDISPLQVVQGHSPFRNLVNRFGNELVVAAGKGEPAAVMSNYGFRNVISMDEYASYFDNIDPLAPYKRWMTTGHKEESRSSPKVLSQRVKTAFIVSDPVDWSRDIQVLCDILRTGGLPGKEFGPQPHLYFANDDLDYQTSFPTERLGMGAFRIAFESIFNRVHDNPLEYTSFGKPNPSVFKNAQEILTEIVTSAHSPNQASPHLRTLYMIGDNPKIDIRGARQAGNPWFSILTRSGVFKGKDNHPEFPADLVVDTVEEAVDFILTRESAKQGSL